MVLTDTHTHIYYEEDPEKLDQLMARCLDNKVERLFLPNVDLKSVTLIDELVKNYPDHCYAMAGLHPCDVKEDFNDAITQLHTLAQDRKIYAVGEIGIDLYWDKTTLNIQQQAFEQQIDWAIDADLPIVIHCREAFNEVFEVLESKAHPKLRGIFHCFTGDLAQAQRAIKMKFMLGIGGVVTYKKAGLDMVLNEVPIEHIVLETDAPYLAPVPFRGKPNESSYLTYIAHRVAEIYGLSMEEVAYQTTANSKKIFQI